MNRELIAWLVVAAALAGLAGVAADWAASAYVARINADLSYPAGPKLDGGAVPVNGEGDHEND